MLSISNYYRRNANQNDNRNPNTSDRISECLQTVTGGRPGDNASPVQFHGKGLEQQPPRKDSNPPGWKIFSRKYSLGF